MTYEDAVRMYVGSGGTMFQPSMDVGYYDQAAPQPVPLPDGRMAFADRDGTIRVAERTPDGQFHSIQTWAPGAQAPAESMESFEPGRNLRRSLTGAASLLAAPVAAAYAPALLGTNTAASAALPLVDDWAAAGSLLSTNPATIASAAAPAVANTVANTAAGSAPSAATAAAGTAAAGTGADYYGNEGRNYPTPESTQGPGGSPVNASTSGGVPTVNLSDMPGDVVKFLRENAPWLLPALGAGAAIAGNDDITNETKTRSTSSLDTSGTSKLTGGSSTSSQSSLAPWLDGAAQDYVGRARQLANAPTTNQYLDRAGDLLMGADSDPLIQAARAQQQGVIGGSMLGPNPFIDQYARGIADRMGEGYATGTRAGIFSRLNNDGNSVFSKSATGQTVGMADRNFGDSLGQTMAGLYMNNYNTERAAQDAASRNSLNFGTYGQGVANNLSQFGQADWMRPILANQQYGQAINPAFGSQQTGNTTMSQNGSTTGYQTGSTTGTTTQNITAPNAWMAGLGGAAAGAGIYRTMFPPQRG